MGWEDSLEDGMETHSNIPAWRIPWTEEPGGLQSTGQQRVGHDWATKYNICTRAVCTHTAEEKTYEHIHVFSQDGLL